ncbi:hypothetical protein [Ruminococcus sp.]|uniref:hypothetical protein n=1 Tax=Ruminococcus sp. TaxID=41978 RepID=UPI0025D4BE79|nr:hypothetical protein [Ruminococcus sp.]MCR4638487.1 hypothetical protein [Ruminococcus sp.]
MEKSKKFNMIKNDIILLKKKVAPQIELKKHFGKKIIKSIPSAVLRAHYECIYASHDPLILDPLLFYIPAFAADPYTAADLLVEAIRDYDFNDEKCSYLDQESLDEFYKNLKATFGVE